MSVNPQPSACPGCEALAAELERLREMVLDQGDDVAAALNRTVKLRGWLDDLAEGRDLEAARPALSRTKGHLGLVAPVSEAG